MKLVKLMLCTAALCGTVLVCSACGKNDKVAAEDKAKTEAESETLPETAVSEPGEEGIDLSQPAALDDKSEIKVDTKNK